MVTPEDYAFTKDQEMDFSRWILSGYGDDRLLLAACWIKQTLNPEDIFSSTELDKWAESEGYVKA